MKNSGIALHWQIIFGLLAGTVFAFLSSWLGWSKFTLDWINPWGVIFINLLRLIAVPLVLFSIIKGITGLSDASALGRLGVKTIFIYLITTLTAVTLGLVIGNIIKPGKLINKDQRIVNRIKYEQWAKETYGEITLDDQCFTCDAAIMAKYKDQLNTEEDASAQEFVSNNMETRQRVQSQGPLQFVVDMVPSNIFLSLSSNSLMLQVIVFALFFGIALLMIPKDNAEPLMKIVDAFNDVFLKMVDMIMKASPFFVFALLAGTISRMAGNNPANVVEIFKGLGWYSLAVLVGLGIMIFAFYPLLVVFFTKNIVSYKGFFRGISDAQILAFSTSSSAATLPVTMECVNENLKVSKKITSFVLPIGATVNMDGTSLYQAVAVLFLAQIHMIDLTIGQQLMVVLTATLASIGSAAVPSAGLIMMMLVLESVGLNPAWIAIIFPIDRILDMCRTVVNVTGDAAVSTIIAKSENELQPSNITKNKPLNLVETKESL